MLEKTSSFEVNEKGFVSGKRIGMKCHVLSRTVIVDGKSEISVLRILLFNHPDCRSMGQPIFVS